MYSQNDEEKFIIEYFKDCPNGRFLDIGAYDGVISSNTRKLFESGWEGVLVEPSPACFVNLLKNYKGVTGVTLINAAISKWGGLVLFHDSGGDMFSTTDNDHFKKWSARSIPFAEFYVKSMPIYELLNFAGTKYDFISIDAEGISYEIFAEIVDRVIGVRMYCVEHDGKIPVMENIMSGRGFKKVASNAENVIFSL